MKKLLLLAPLALLLTGCPDDTGGVSNTELNQAIGDHAAQGSAHHTKTTDAGEITTGVFDGARIPGGSGAGSGVIDFNVLTTSLSQNATISTGSGGGVVLPDTGNGGFNYAFTVPADFTGTEFTIHWEWFAQSTGCDVIFRSNYNHWRRAGTAPKSGGSVSAGIADPAAAAAPAIVGYSTATETTLGPGGNGWTDILPGDSIHWGLFRSPLNAADTCVGNVVIQSVQLFYDNGSGA